MLVSIIIPVYNVERYINRCLESVCNQTYQEIEIILVDDGSSDNSGRICDSFSATDNRVRVIHKTNGGLSSARNAGLAIARGEYITFLDSDDFLSKNYVKKSLELCLMNKAEISIMKMVFVKEGDNDERIVDNCEPIKSLTPAEAIKESLYQRLFSCCAPGKMYSKNSLINIMFPEGRLSEDLAVCHLILKNASKIIYCGDVGYYYRQRETSIMHVFNERRLDALDWTSNIEQFCKTYYPSLIRASLCRTFNVAIHLILELPNEYGSSTQLYKRIMGEIKRTRMTVIKDRDVRVRDKIAAILSFLGIYILRKAWNSRFALRNDR